MTEATEPTFADRMSEDYTGVVAKLAAKLRQMADEVERRSIRTNLHDMKPDHAYHAGDTVHTLSWGFANLNLERLISAAAEADRAARSE
jgi:hypothetical protein